MESGDAPDAGVAEIGRAPAAWTAIFGNRLRTRCMRRVLAIDRHPLPAWASIPAAAALPTGVAMRPWPYRATVRHGASPVVGLGSPDSTA